jgi:hypothetical protein
MSQVAAALTPSDAKTMAGAMVWGYRKATGRNPSSVESWLYPLAVSSLETAHWTAMYNYNAGNITTSGNEDWYANPGVTMNLKFIAYDNAGAGCEGEISWLNSHGVLQHADAGDYSGFMSAMTASGYGGAGNYPDLQNIISNLSHVVPGGYSPYFGNSRKLLDVALMAGGIIALGAFAAETIRAGSVRASVTNLRRVVARYV